MKKQLLSINSSGLLAHAVGNNLTIFIDSDKGFCSLISWAPFEQDISAICWYDATNIPEVTIPIIVIASVSKKVCIYDLCSQKNIISFNLTGESATVMKWSPNSSSRFFIGTGNGDFHCCSLILGNETNKFDIEWTINLGFAIDFISFEHNFADNALVASKSGNLNFIYDVHSNDPKISSENYSLCGENNEIFSIDFLDSSSNYLLVVSKLGTIIYTIAQQESFNLFNDDNLTGLFPVKSDGRRLIGVNNETMSLYKAEKGNFVRIYELPIMPTVSNLPPFQTEFVCNYDRIIYVSYNWWLTTVKLYKNKLFVTNRVRLLPGKPLDFSFRIKSVAMCTSNGFVLATRTAQFQPKQKLDEAQPKESAESESKKTQAKEADNNEKQRVPRYDSDANLLGPLGSTTSNDLNKIAAKSIIYHQRRRSFGSAESDEARAEKDSQSKNQKPAFEIIQDANDDFGMEKKIRNSDLERTVLRQRKSSFALKKNPIDQIINGKEENPKPAEASEQTPQQSPQKTPTNSQPTPNVEPPKRKPQAIRFAQPPAEVSPSASFPPPLQPSTDKKEPIPKFGEQVPRIPSPKPTFAFPEKKDGEPLPSMSSKTNSTTNIHANPTVLSQSHRLRSLSMHQKSGNNDALKKIAESAKKHYKPNEFHEEYTTISEFGEGRSFVWCFKLCNVPLSQIEWITSTKVLAFGTEMRGQNYVHHLFLVDFKNRRIKKVLNDRLNAINLPFSSLLVNRYQKVCAIVLGDAVVMFINLHSSTPKLMGSMCLDSKTIVSFSPTAESTKALLVCQNNVLFIDYDTKNNTIKQTEKCVLDTKKQITAALWKRMSLVLGDEDGNIIIVSFSPYQREDFISIKNEITQIVNYQQSNMLIVDSKNIAYIISPRKIEFTFPYQVKQIHQASNNEFVVRGFGKGALSAISIRGRFRPSYPPSITNCIIMKPRLAWTNILKEEISRMKNDSDMDVYIKMAEKYGMSLIKNILINVKNPNFYREQLRFIRDMVITNSHLSDLAMKLSLMLDEYDNAKVAALKTDKSSNNYLINIYKALLLSASPNSDSIRECVLRLFLDDMNKEGVDLLLMFGMWQEAVSKLVSMKNVKEAMNVLLVKSQNNQKSKEFIKSFDKKLIDSDHMSMRLLLTALFGELKLVIDKLRDLGEFEQASFLEKIQKQ